MNKKYPFFCNLKYFLSLKLGNNQSRPSLSNKNKYLIPLFAFIFLTLLMTGSVLAITGYASPSKVILSGDVGKTFYRHITVKNLNNVPVNIIISTPYSNIKLSKTNFRLEAGANQTVDYNVTIVEEGEVNENININFLPDSGSGVVISSSLVLIGVAGNLEENNPLEEEIITGNEDILITADLNPLTPNIIEGSDMIIDATFMNTGDVKTTYVISANSYSGWGDLLAIYPQTITLEPYESKNVMIHFHIKDGASGYEQFNIKASYAGVFKEEVVEIDIDKKISDDLIDIAYIAKNSGSPDYNFIDAMDTLGYNYDIIGSSDVPTTDFSQYKMILLGDERISNVPVNNYKSLIANPDYYRNFSQSKATSTQANIYNINQNISITQGLDQYFSAYVQSGISIYYLTGAKYNTKSVSTAGNSTVDRGRYVIAVKDNPRRVFFGITKSNYWSDESRELFFNSIDWLINGEDRDGDGYFSDYDCNDSDSGLWRNVLAYVDSDNDDYGARDLVNVCIGDNLISRYSYINGDCDDNVANIHPNSLEIPYDGIDQTCNGYDLADLDEDGYCKSGYNIQNAAVQCSYEIENTGTDCDDIDEEVNPSSDDVFKNCRNDAPIVDDIEKIIVNEGEDVIIIVSAIDPEDDEMSYTINDSRFTIDDNIFVWETSYNDENDYEFRVSVSDGSLTTTTNVEVEVSNKNRAPVCSDIPELIWDENKNTTLNLSYYCSDPDGDSISYEFYDSSDYNLNVDGINNGIAIVSSSRYWDGEGWIQFIASDGNDETLTNEINIIVNHVNQPPEFMGRISNVTLYEATNSTNRIYLGNYFYDRDSNLSYSVAGNNNIGIDIINGFVNFYPALDFVGNESVIFSASDGEFNLDSNEILLNVLYVNKPPKFGEINCQTGILENIEYSCQVNASDIENDSFSFSVVDEDNLNCHVSGNILNYTGAMDYYGNASCKIRVSDETGFSDYVLNVLIDHVNQAPRIYSHSPLNESVRILENTNKEFRIGVRDVDSNMTINWYIGDENLGNGSIFNFNKTMGWYNLTAVARDEELNSSFSWNVYVGKLNDFKCSEVGGHLCSSNQVCNGNILGVYDAGNCCSIACSSKPIEFKNIKRENSSSDVELTIVKPVTGNEFHTGDKIPIELKIDNQADNSVDFDVYVYLYDLTKQDVVEKASDSFKLSKKTYKTIYPEIEISRKIKESDEFYIFAKIEGKNGKNIYYDDKYVKIILTRKGDDVVIESVEIEPKDILCGDDIHVTVKVRNYGTKSQEGYVSIQNSVLKINNQTPEFIIDSYDDSSNGDIVIEELNLKVDDYAVAGNYTIKSSVLYSAGINTNTDDTNIVLGECRIQNTETQSIETTTSPSIKLESIVSNKSPLLQQKEIVVFMSTITMLVVFILVVIAGKVYRRNMLAERKEYVQKFIKKINSKKRK